MARRVLFMWFPHLAAELALRRGAAAPARPFAIVAMRSGGWRLCSVNAAAAQAGLSTAMSLADARARVPELATAPEQAARERAFLAALGRWSMRYTPWVALDPPDGLALDVAGSAHLFGGEAALAAAAEARLAAQGLSARIGIADVLAAASALARFAPRAPSLAPPGRALEAVAELPIAALRIEAETVAALGRVGLRRIADLAAQPRAALTRRFGPALGWRLDQLSGAAPEPAAPLAVARPYATRLHLPEPIGALCDLRAGLERLLAALCARLRREGLGARALRLTVQRCDGGGDRADLALARPMDDPARLASLFIPRLETLKLGFGVDVLRLEARAVEPLRPEQREAFDAAGAQAAALEDLISRIGARIGPDQTTRFTPRESHLPELAFARQPAISGGAAPAFSPEGPPRPLTLFPPEPLRPEGAGAPPEAFHWRGRRFETLSAAGPERIAPEWWRDDPGWRAGPRDYWRVQTTAGRRLWLFRVHQPADPNADRAVAWFAQGEFA